MSVSDHDIIFACARKFYPPSAERVAEEIARSIFLPTDLIAQSVADRLVADLISRGILNEITTAVAEKLAAIAAEEPRK